MRQRILLLYMYSGPWQLTKYIVKQEGPFALFKGLQATLAREMPGYFFFFGGYETTRYFLSTSGQSKDDIGMIMEVFFFL